jgi:hypothetical protein
VSEDLYGTWRLQSFVQRSVATGEKTDVFGKHPRGFLSYSRDGRMYAMLVKDGRHRPSDTEELSYQKRADLYDTMYAYAGTFSFDGATVTHHVDISWNESWTASDQRRNVRLEGDTLYISTDPSPGPDGGNIVSELMWERIKP